MTERRRRRVLWLSDLWCVSTKPSLAQRRLKLSAKRGQDNNAVCCCSDWLTMHLLWGPLLGHVSHVLRYFLDLLHRYYVSMSNVKKDAYMFWKVLVKWARQRSRNFVCHRPTCRRLQRLYGSMHFINSSIKSLHPWTLNAKNCNVLSAKNEKLQIFTRFRLFDRPTSHIVIN